VQLLGENHPNVFVTAGACPSPIEFFVTVQSEASTATTVVPGCNYGNGTMPLPPQPRYDPPNTVPIGQICPVL
jgi:hypothetical protein